MCGTKESVYKYVWHKGEPIEKMCGTTEILFKSSSQTPTPARRPPKIHNPSAARNVCGTTENLCGIKEILYKSSSQTPTPARRRPAKILNPSAARNMCGTKERVASRSRRSLFGQATSIPQVPRTCDHKHTQVHKQSRKVSGKMTRLKAAFSDSGGIVAVESPVGQGGDIFPSSPS